jgi:hypothetical protein
MRPSKLPFLKIVHLCFLAIVNKRQFIKEENKDNEIRSRYPPEEEKPHGIYIVVKAFWKSLFVIISSAIVGAILGFMLRFYFFDPSSIMISMLQIIGACLLLWGTLFIRGWEIQTYCSVTLTERINQLLYRGLYCLGTIIMICSLIWCLK